MVRARQEVRALERLREKALDAWRKEAGRAERRFLDDLRPAASLLTSPSSPGGKA
jgi:flagellar biosynthesis chaperone FliJ